MREIEGIKEAMEILKPHWEEIENDFDRHNRRFLQLATADHDAIGRVLRTHLVVENFLKSFLQEQFGLEDFEELRLTFAQKAKMLPAAKSSASFGQDNAWTTSVPGIEKLIMVSYPQIYRTITIQFGPARATFALDGVRYQVPGKTPAMALMAVHLTCNRIRHPADDGTTGLGPRVEVLGAYEEQ